MAEEHFQDLTYQVPAQCTHAQRVRAAQAAKEPCEDGRFPVRLLKTPCSGPGGKQSGER